MGRIITTSIMVLILIAGNWGFFKRRKKRKDRFDFIFLVSFNILTVFLIVREIIFDIY
jgi:hypothetical protein